GVRGMVEGRVGEGIVHRAVEKGLARIGVHDLRDFTDDKHKSVDDAPFGGGPGMVMKAEPFCRALERILPAGPTSKDAVVLLSPRGRRFDQKTAERYARLERLVLPCGRYEGIAERGAPGGATPELGPRDVVLTGGGAGARALG